VKSGDIVRVRVVGLGAYMRKWHDSLGLVLEVDAKKRIAKVLFESTLKTFSFDLIEIVNEESIENNETRGKHGSGIQGRV